jgi:undecaprenyl diphosphate synthase
MTHNATIPHHVAIIMDGNGRWAGQRGLPRTMGHRQGVERVKEIVAASREAGVKVLTLFAFSTENWKRPKREINVLMRFLEVFLEGQRKEMIKKNIRFMVTGRTERLPARLQKKLRETSTQTQGNTGLILNLALNYGSRQEITDAARAFARLAAEGRAQPDDLDEEMFGSYLYTSGLPDPDLLIRTSGEYRISNFLLWQLAYTELYFTETLWPDFREEEFLRALLSYQQRDRRFGLTQEQIEAQA